MENETMIVNLQDIDITGSEAFDEYAAFKSNLGAEMEEYPFPRTYLPAEIKERNEALSRSLNNLSPAARKEKADALINAQKLNSHSDFLDHMAAKANNGYGQFSSKWSPILWQAGENASNAKVSVNGNLIEAVDLDYLIAEGLQQLYASEDPRAEYHDWVEQQHKIEVDLNTNGATEEEIATRNAFISFLDDRETEMKRVMFLYAGAAFNFNSRQQKAAQEKLKFLTFKLSELRRLREKTHSTKSRADSREYFEKLEHRKQHEALAATAGLAAIAALSLGEERIRQKNNVQALEQGIGETFINLHPDTQTRQEAEQKIEDSKQNALYIKAMFEAMRNGMSKEEWLQKHASQHSSSVRSKVRNLRGFNVKDYNDYANS